MEIETPTTLHEFGTTNFQELYDTIDFQLRKVVVYGRTYNQPRLTKWYGDVSYVYSGLEWEADPMPDLLQNMRTKIDTITGIDFNSVLCNLYRDGSDCVGWHSDDEPVFGGDPVVGSLSFGTTREFQLRKRNNHKILKTLELTDGGLLVMEKGTQKHWQHCVPRTNQAVGPRINLTFRKTI